MMPWDDSNSAIISGRTHSEIARKIRDVESINLSRAPFPYVQEMVEIAIEGYTRNELSIDYVHPLYRARRCDNGNNWTKKSELWYNSDFSQIDFGRANPPNTPILYLSSTIETAITEIRPNPGDLVNVIEVRSTKKPHRVSALDFLIFEPEILPRLNITRSGFEINLEKLLGKHDYSKNERIKRFISSEFRRKVDFKHQYKISSAISKCLWLEEDKHDSLVYPSIVSDFSSINVALKPEFADSNFEVVCAYNYLVKTTGKSQEYILQSEAGFDAATNVFAW